MKLSTKSRYGLNAMYYMALNNDNQPMSITELSKITKVSQPYLEKVLATLKKKGLVVSTRGALGGYTLKKQPNEITIGEILRALEKDLIFSDCVNSGKCNNVSCPNKGIFTTLYEKLNNVLDEMTLFDMIKERREK